MSKQSLIDLYTSHTGMAPTAVDEMPSSGSNRRYYRLHGNPTLIGVVGTNLKENEAFIYMDMEATE